MSAKYTPGPWSYDLDDNGNEATPIRAGGGALIASVYGAVDFPCLEENEIPMVAEAQVANARLIAASTDLLEACENLENDAGQIPDHAWKMIQDAIEKAGGCRK